MAKFDAQAKIALENYHDVQVYEAQQYVYATVRGDGDDEGNSWQTCAKKALRSFFKKKSDLSPSVPSQNVVMQGHEADDIPNYEDGGDAGEEPFCVKKQFEKELLNYEKLKFRLQSDKQETIVHRKRWSQCN